MLSSKYESRTVASHVKSAVYLAVYAAMLFSIPAVLANADTITVPAPVGAQIVAQLSRSDVAETPLKLQIPALVNVKEFTCGQLPGIGTFSPFPLNIRVGAMLSPVGKIAVGADVTITGFHVLGSLMTRIDGDVILGSNLSGSQTIIPITVDELYSKNLIGGTTVYFGGGIGMFFGGKTRFGGKIVAGASIRRIALEANVDFAGIGDPLFLLQARLGL